MRNVDKSKKIRDVVNTDFIDALDAGTCISVANKLKFSSKKAYKEHKRTSSKYGKKKKYSRDTIRDNKYKEFAKGRFTQNYY